MEEQVSALVSVRGNGCAVRALVGCCDRAWPFLLVSVVGGGGGCRRCVVVVVVSAQRVDDPLDAVAVHMGGGLWGLVAVALFQDGGIVFGSTPEVLAWNMAGALAIIGWSGGFSCILFGTLRLLGILRVPLEMEIQGLDILKHGEPAYPAESWQENQYNNSTKNEDVINRNSYLPPNMSAPPPWHPSWNNYQYPVPFPGPEMFWTLPDP